MNEPIQHAKGTLRRQFRSLLAGVAPGDAAAWSLALCEHLLDSGLAREDRPVMLFFSLPGEPDLGGFAQSWLARGGPLCAPAVDWTAGRLVPRAVADLSDALVVGRYGVREPAPDARPVPPGEIGLVLVPGLAFDGDGNRLGRGAGFYDRFLADPALRGPFCGVAFGLQIAHHVPHDRLDVPVHAIATEQGILRPPIAR